MNKPKLVYVSYIATTPQKLFDALTDPELTRRYWANHRNASDWKVGSAWRHEDYDDPAEIDVVGKVIENDPPHRLVVSWADPDDADDLSKHSRVTFEIAPFSEVVRLTVTHDELEPGSHMVEGVSFGWPGMLSNLKSFLETGEPLDMSDVWGKHAAAAPAASA